MSLMLRLTRNELEKISHQWRIVIAFAFCTLIALAVAFIGGRHHGFGPSADTLAFTFLTGGFSAALIPLGVCLVAGDVVAGEFSGGTIKLLLTRPVSRWKIWLSKFFAAALASWAIMLYFYAVIYFALAYKYGFGHWSDPPLAMQSNGLVTAWAVTWHVVLTESLSVLALVAFVALLSSLTSSGVAGIGLSFGAIIIGGIFIGLAGSKTWLRYLIFPQLSASDHFIGSFPVPNCTLAFSIGVLCAWLLGSVALGMWRFQSRDILA